MSREHAVVIVPGIGDRTAFFDLTTRHWPRVHKLMPVVHPMHWTDGQDLEPKLSGLDETIQRHLDTDRTVSLLAISAGMSAALLAFRGNREIHALAGVAGRVRTSDHCGKHPFIIDSHRSPAFHQAVEIVEYQESVHPRTDGRPILTMRARYGDERVPGFAVVVQGANNRTIPTIGHVPTIAGALTVFSRPLIAFLKDQ